MFDYNKDTDFYQACARATIDDVKYMLDHDSNIWNGYLIACQCGNIEAVQWLAIQNDTLDHARAFKLACTNGHLNIAQWLASVHKNDDNDYIWHIFYEVCVKGYLDVIKWLRNKYDIIEKNMTMGEDPRGSADDNLEVIFQLVCHGGHTHVAEWLFKNYYDIGIYFEASSAFTEVRDNADLNAMKWLYDRYPKIDVKICNFHGTCKINIPVVEWLLQVGNFDDIDIGNLLCAACKLGCLDVAKWLINKRSDITITEYAKYSTWCQLFRPDNIELVMLFHKVCPLTSDNVSKRHMYDNCNIHVTKFIASLNIHVDLEYTDCGLIIKQGVVDTVNWCLGHLGIHCDFESLKRDMDIATRACVQYTDLAFQRACVNGYLDVAQWLADNYTIYNFDTLETTLAERDFRRYDLYTSVCEAGHTHVAEWLNDVMHYQVADLQLACNQAVINGHLDTLIFLHNRFNITCYDAMFPIAVKHGWTDIVIWLRQVHVNLNIYANSFEAFKSVCYTKETCLRYLAYCTRENDIKYYSKGAYKYVVAYLPLNCRDLEYIGCYKNLNIYGATPSAPLKYAMEYINYLSNNTKKSVKKLTDQMH